MAGDPLTALELSLAITAMGELETLSKLHGGELETKLNESIRSTGEQISGLNKQIDRERLLGQVRQGQQTPAQQLRGEYQQHLALLNDIKNKKAAFGFGESLIQAQRQADELLKKAQGDAAVEITTAGADRWSLELKETARAEAFKCELLAYKASPKLYMLDRYLDVWDEVLPSLNKYVIGVDPRKLELWVDMQHEPAGIESFLSAPQPQAGKEGSEKK